MTDQISCDAYLGKTGKTIFAVNYTYDRLLEGKNVLFLSDELNQRMLRNMLISLHSNHACLEQERVDRHLGGGLSYREVRYSRCEGRARGYLACVANDLIENRGQPLQMNFPRKQNWKDILLETIETHKIDAVVSDQAQFSSALTRFLKILSVSPHPSSGLRFSTLMTVHPSRRSTFPYTLDDIPEVEIERSMDRIWSGDLRDGTFLLKMLKSRDQPIGRLVASEMHPVTKRIGLEALLEKMQAPFQG